MDNTTSILQQNIRANWKIVQENQGPNVVTVVSGSSADQRYWNTHIEAAKGDVFRADFATRIISVYESTRRGNFLGTLNGWRETLPHLGAEPLPNVSLMSMVFGLGTRFSPFTQALKNRKAAFPIPLKSKHSSMYLTTVDMSNLYSNIWHKHIEDSGFKGLIAKWGDEAIIPGKIWETADYSHLDAIRFGWKTSISEDMAREKEWIVLNEATGIMTKQLARQSLETLQSRLANMKQAHQSVAVNLGSLAVSYQFLEVALQVFGSDIDDASKWVDWDPYIWMALHCEDEAEWRSEIAYEESLGKDTIRLLEQRYPDFYAKVSRLRSELEKRTGRPLAVGVLDFGQPYWVDLGLHLTLRTIMQALTDDSDRGTVTREIFGVPLERDKNGNTLLNSSIADGIQIRNSVIMDSRITDARSVVNNGVIVGSNCDLVQMPDGGCAFFCNVKRLRIEGQNAFAFQSVADELVLSEGDRHTTLQMSNGIEHLKTNENVLDYKGDNYFKPILSNRISFDEAASLMAAEEAN